jgi:hypothetical protein
MRDIRVSVEVRAPLRPLRHCRMPGPESRHRVMEVGHVAGRLRGLGAGHRAWTVGNQVRLMPLAAAGCRLGARIPASVRELAGVVRGI